LSLRVSGYQFPDAEDLRERFSWHMVAGSVRCAEGDWTFEWQALTCGESPVVSRWFRAVASSVDASPHTSALKFTEPNLRFEATTAEGKTTVTVSFDLEFQPPWRARGGAGSPYRVHFTDVNGQLMAAADEWDADLAAYPDGLAT
jgi:hypothetical protein